MNAKNNRRISTVSAIAVCAAWLTGCAAPKAPSWGIFTGYANQDKGQRMRLVAQGNLTDRFGTAMLTDIGASHNAPNDFTSHYTQLRPLLNIVDLAEGRYKIGALGMLETFPGKDSIQRGGGAFTIPLDKGVLQLRILPARGDGIDEGRYDVFFRRNFGRFTLESFLSHRNGELGEKTVGELTPTLNAGDYGIGVHLKIDRDGVTPYFAVERRF